MSEHTPTPWAADPDDREGYEWNVHIVEAARPHMRIAFTSNGPDSEANAAFIVKAVNNHPALVAALEEIEDLGANGETAAHLGNIAHATLIALRVAVGQGKVP